MSTGSPDGLRKRVRVGSIVVRCRRFDEMLAFWQAALGYLPQAPPQDGWVILTDPTGRSPNISLDRVEHPPPLGEVSRVHLDLYPTMEQERLSACWDWAQAATSEKPGRMTRDLTSLAGVASSPHPKTRKQPHVSRAFH